MTEGNGAWHAANYMLFWPSLHHPYWQPSTDALYSDHVQIACALQAIPGEAGVFRQALLVKELHQNAQATFVHNFALAPLAYLQN